MGGFKEWYFKQPIRRQLLSTFVFLVVTSLALIIGLCLAYLFLMKGILINQSTDALVSQMQENMHATSAESADVVRTIFNRGTTSFLNFYAYATEDALRGPKTGTNFHYYSLGGSVDTFQENGQSSLPGPLTTIPRYGSKLIGLEASTWFMPGKPKPSYRGELTATQQVVVNYTQHVDTFFVRGFDLNKDFVAGYIGFKDNTFRTYPAVETISTDSSRVYSCTERGWYEAVENADEGFVNYGSPYLDFNGKGWMITMSRPLYGNLACTSTTNCGYTADGFAGVAGADMLLEDLYNELAPIKIGESGKVILLETSGQVVADRDFDLEGSDSFYFSELTTPTISQELMNEMAVAEVNTSTVVELTSGGERYLLNYYRIREFNGKYIIVTTVLESEVTAPIEALTSDTNAKALEISTVLVVVGVSLTVVLAIIIVFLTHQIVQPIEHLTRTSKQIAQNIGRGDIFYGIEEYKGTSALGEIQRLNSHANTMISTLRAEQKEAKTSSLQQNQYYHNSNNVWDQGQAAIDAPPPPFDEDNSLQVNGGEHKGPHLVMGSQRGPIAARDQYHGHEMDIKVSAPPVFNPNVPQMGVAGPIVHFGGHDQHSPALGLPEEPPPPPFNPNAQM
jgi:hypothetical protein